MTITGNSLVYHNEEEQKERKNTRKIEEIKTQLEFDIEILALRAEEAESSEERMLQLAFSAESEALLTLLHQQPAQFL